MYIRCFCSTGSEWDVNSSGRQLHSVVGYVADCPTNSTCQRLLLRVKIVRNLQRIAALNEVMVTEYENV